MATKTGELREQLMTCIEQVVGKKMAAEDATAISKLAAQITLSMKVEADIRLEGFRGEKLPLGQMAIGEEQKAIEGGA